MNKNTTIFVIGNSSALRNILKEFSNIHFIFPQNISNVLEDTLKNYYEIENIIDNIIIEYPIATSMSSVGMLVATKPTIQYYFKDNKIEDYCDFSYADTHLRINNFKGLLCYLESSKDLSELFHGEYNVNGKKNFNFFTATKLIINQRDNSYYPMKSAEILRKFWRFITVLPHKCQYSQYKNHSHTNRDFNCTISYKERICSKCKNSIYEPLSSKEIHDKWLKNGCLVQEIYDNSSIIYSEDNQ